MNHAEYTISVDELSVDELSVDELSVDELSVDEHLSVVGERPYINIINISTGDPKDDAGKNSTKLPYSTPKYSTYVDPADKAKSLTDNERQEAKKGKRPIHDQFCKLIDGYKEKLEKNYTGFTGSEKKNIIKNLKLLREKEDQRFNIDNDEEWCTLTNSTKKQLEDIYKDTEQTEKFFKALTGTQPLFDQCVQGAIEHIESIFIASSAVTLKSKVIFAYREYLIDRITRKIATKGFRDSILTLDDQDGRFKAKLFLIDYEIHACSALRIFLSGEKISTSDNRNQYITSFLEGFKRQYMYANLGVDENGGNADNVGEFILRLDEIKNDMKRSEIKIIADQVQAFMNENLGVDGKGFISQQDVEIFLGYNKEEDIENPDAKNLYREIQAYFYNFTNGVVELPRRLTSEKDKEDEFVENREKLSRLLEIFAECICFKVISKEKENRKSMYFQSGPEGCLGTDPHKRITPYVDEVGREYLLIYFKSKKAAQREYEFLQPNKDIWLEDSNSIMCPRFKGNDLNKALDDCFANDEFDEVRFLKIIQATEKSLEDLHKKGIIHGDVRPENIKIDWQGDKCIANIFDFGNATRAEEDYSEILLRKWRSDTVQEDKTSHPDIYSDDNTVRAKKYHDQYYFLRSLKEYLDKKDVTVAPHQTKSTNNKESLKKISNILDESLQKLEVGSHVDINLHTLLTKNASKGTLQPDQPALKRNQENELTTNVTPSGRLWQSNNQLKEMYRSSFDYKLQITNLNELDEISHYANVESFEELFRDYHISINLKHEQLEGKGKQFRDIFYSTVKGGNFIVEGYDNKNSPFYLDILQDIVDGGACCSTPFQSESLIRAITYQIGFGDISNEDVSKHINKIPKEHFQYFNTSSLVHLLKEIPTCEGSLCVKQLDTSVLKNINSRIASFENHPKKGDSTNFERNLKVIKNTSNLYDRLAKIKDPKAKLDLQKSLEEKKIEDDDYNYLNYDILNELLVAATADNNNNNKTVKSCILNVESCIINDAFWNEDLPLFTACKAGHLNIVKILAEKPSFSDTINKGGSKGSILLHEASSHGNIEIVRFLVEKGANVNEADKDGNTPLSIASEMGHLDICKLFLDQPSFERKSNKDILTKILHKAVETNNHKWVKLCLEKGANVNEADKDGNTPLSIASEMGHLDICKLFLDQPSFERKSNKDILTKILLKAVETNNHKWVELCLEKGADIDQPDKDGIPPLSIASKKGHLHIVQLLVENGADINKLNRRESTPLHYASFSGHACVAKYLVEKGANTNQVNVNKNTPLLSAYKNGHGIFVSLLSSDNKSFENKSNQDILTKLLHKVVEKNNLKLVALCLKQVSDKNLLAEILHKAIEKNNCKLVKLCLEKGADINNTQYNSTGRTPLIAAICNNNAEMVDLLLLSGADVNKTNKDEVSPLLISLSWRQSIEQQKILQLLLKHKDIQPNMEKVGETALEYLNRCNFTNRSYLHPIEYFAHNFPESKRFKALKAYAKSNKNIMSSDNMKLISESILKSSVPDDDERMIGGVINNHINRSRPRTYIFPWLQLRSHSRSKAALRSLKV